MSPGAPVPPSVTVPGRSDEGKLPTSTWGGIGGAVEAASCGERTDAAATVAVSSGGAVGSSVGLAVADGDGAEVGVVVGDGVWVGVDVVDGSGVARMATASAGESATASPRAVKLSTCSA